MKRHFMTKVEFKKELKNMNLTQKKIAEMMGSGISTVSKWEIVPDHVYLIIELLKKLDVGERAKFVAEWNLSSN
jgi:transcriptional regulator with XRE-family HTH domain